MVLGFVIGPLEFVILIVVVILLFGGKRFGSAMRSLGKGAREFKGSLSEDEEARKELPRGEPAERDEL
jgi:sec-independent protein translocase protein TatA